MSSSDAVILSVSRPKVHRLPKSLSAQNQRPRFAVIPFLRSQLLLHAHRGVRMTVLLMVVSFVLFVAARVVSPSPSGEQADFAESKVKAGDAMASLPERQRLSPKNSRTIYIEGPSETIVGQLARIPSENGSIADIKTVSEVDNRAGRELLSIIGKY